MGWRDEKPAAVKLQCLTRRAGEMLCVEYILDYFYSTTIYMYVLLQHGKKGAKGGGSPS